MAVSAEDKLELEQLLEAAMEAVDRDTVLTKAKLRAALGILASAGEEEEDAEEPPPPLERAPENRPSATEAAPSSAEAEDEEDEEDDGLVEADKEPYPASGEGVEPSDSDRERAMEFKMAANDAKSNGDWALVVEKLTEAIKIAPSPLMYANRAFALLAMSPPRPNAAVADCNRALSTNPDSAKSLKTRGKAYRMLGKYEEAAKDLRKGCALDFDPESGELKKFVEGRIAKLEARRAKERIERNRRALEEKKRAADEAKRRREQARRDYESSQSAGGGGMGGGFPGGGFPGGFPGGGAGGMGGGGMAGGMQGLMAALMSDPELAAGMQNPKVMEVMQKMMTNPAAAQEAMRSDPEVSSFIQKLMSKMGGMGMGGMGGGGGGFPGGMPGGGMANNDDDDDDDGMPDLEEMNESTPKGWMPAAGDDVD